MDQRLWQSLQVWCQSRCKFACYAAQSFLADLCSLCRPRDERIRKQYACDADPLSHESCVQTQLVTAGCLRFCRSRGHPAALNTLWPPQPFRNVSVGVVVKWAGAKQLCLAGLQADPIQVAFCSEADFKCMLQGRSQASVRTQAAPILFKGRDGKNLTKPCKPLCSPDRVVSHCRGSPSHVLKLRREECRLLFRRGRNL